MSVISRRKFLAGAAGAGALAAGTAAVGFAGCTGAGSTEAGSAGAVVGVPQTWDREADYIVAGLGAAGLGALYQAEQLGIDLASEVLVLEKMDRDNAGNNMYCNAGLLNEKKAENIYATSGFRMDMSKAEQIIEGISTIKTWAFDNLDVEMVVSQSGVVRGAEIVSGGGKALWEAMVAYFEDAGSQIEYGIAAHRLIQHPATGEVIGVEALQDGSPLMIKARKAVILTSGGYEGNPQLVYTFSSADVKYFPASPNNKGEGLLMGISVGAALTPMMKSVDWSFNQCFTKPSEAVGCSIANRIPTSADGANRIKVGPSGRRFVDEAMERPHSKEQFAMFDVGEVGWVEGSFEESKSSAKPAYLNLPAFFVCDQVAFDTANLGNGDIFYNWANARDLYIWDNEDAVAKGYLWKADTLEELANLMVATDVLGEEFKVNKEGLLAEIERYNGFCAAGVDEDFGRKPETLQPISTPPYYAAELSPSIAYSISGLKTDDNSNVINWFGETIPRLYAAGNLATNTFWYPIGMDGCMATAMLAVKHAITLERWDVDTQA